MIKIMFVCHGNICRSPMAEFIFKDYVKKMNTSNMFYVESSATSYEEIGNPVHYGTKQILNRLGIDCSKKRARRMTITDYYEFDYIICMDKNNIRNLNNIIGSDSLNKVSLFLNYANLDRNIKDPWYTGNFEETYNDIVLATKALYDYLLKINKS